MWLYLCFVWYKVVVSNVWVCSNEWNKVIPPKCLQFDECASSGSLNEWVRVQIYLHFPSLSVSSSSMWRWGAMGLRVVEGDANYAVIKNLCIEVIDSLIVTLLFTINSDNGQFALYDTNPTLGSIQAHPITTRIVSLRHKWPPKWWNLKGLNQFYRIIICLNNRLLKHSAGSLKPKVNKRARYCVFASGH